MTNTHDYSKNCYLGCGRVAVVVADDGSRYCAHCALEAISRALQQALRLAES